MNNNCDIINVMKSPYNGSAYEKRIDKAVKLFNKFVEPRKDMPVYLVLLLYRAVYPEIAESYT